MRRLWWQLPGPTRFLNRVEDELREGSSLMLMFPEHLQEDDQKTAVKERLQEANLWDWEELHVRLEDPGEQTPAWLLYERFVPSAPTDAIRNGKTLAEEEEFRGRIIWIHGMTLERWPAWKDLLQEYTQACRSGRPLGRTLFCVVLTGDLTASVPRPAEGISVLKWEGVIGQLDMLLYVSNLLEERAGWSPLQKKLAASVLTAVAKWDRQAADRLALESITSIMSPTDILVELARERGWTTDLPSYLQWSSGMKQQVEGRSVPHSAFLALCGQEAEINKRIWEGQLATLYPFLEESRQVLIQSLRPKLTVPFRPYPDKDYEIRDVFELEIGHLYHQLRDRNDVKNELKEAIYKMRGIRNSLAHLKTVQGHLLEAISDISLKP